VRTSGSVSEGGFVLAIGGFDPSGGAGVVRDFLTARTLGAGVAMVPTAWTEQSPAGVSAIEPRAPVALESAVRAGLARMGGAACAVKIGMVPTIEAAAAIGRALDGFAGPVVFDPVLAASSGGALFAGAPAQLMPLVGRADLVTPNAVEAGALAEVAVDGPAAAVAAAAILCDRGARAVLVKGGHLTGEEAIDVLLTVAADGSRVEQRFAGPRLPGPPVRGTGCALATAIAVGLARGLPRAEAIAGAKIWLTGGLGRSVVVGGERHLP
jgi:hydroxymethylpyrimidine/phosphomethylpyrimidine kinase